MGMKYKVLPQDVIEGFDRSLRAEYPDRDVFFVGSAAALGRVSEATFRNYLRNDPTLGFIDKLPGGQVATCSQSLQAWRQYHETSDGRKNVKTWEANCIRMLPATDTSSGSAAIGGIMGQGQYEKK